MNGRTDFKSLEEAWLSCAANSTEDINATNIRVARETFYAGAMAAMHMIKLGNQVQIFHSIHQFLAEEKK